MKQRVIPYDDSSILLRMEFPSQWACENVTGVNIKIVQSSSGSELLASTSATVYTATTLDGAVSSGTGYITLAAGAGDVVQGDRLRLINPLEEVTVKSYNTTSKRADLERTLYYDHADSDDVYPCWATYTLDTSDTSTFAENDALVIIWTATGIDNATVYDSAIIRDRSYSPSAYSRRFQVLYPREYSMVEDRVNEFLDECITMCAIELRNNGIDTDMFVDTDVLDPVYLKYARWQATMIGGDSWSYEHDTALKNFLDSIEWLKSQPYWVDEDGDNTEDDEEVTDRQMFDIWRAF